MDHQPPAKSGDMEETQQENMNGVTKAQQPKNLESRVRSVRQRQCPCNQIVLTMALVVGQVVSHQLPNRTFDVR